MSTSCLRLAVLPISILLVLQGCSWNYEIYEDDAAGIGEGGASGIGDGDGDSVGGSSSGDGDGDGDGDSVVGGGNSGGDGAGGLSGSVGGQGPGAGGEASSGGGADGSGGLSESGGSAGTGGDLGVGGDGASSGGASSGGASSGGASSGGAAGGTPDYTTTTGVDEDDPGATVAMPGGTGLSLREAIKLANSVPGHEIIEVDTGVTTVLTSTLPGIVDAVDILGGGAVIDATGVGGNLDCMVIDTSDVLIDNIEMFGCGGNPIYMPTGSGPDIEIVNSHFHDNGDQLLLLGDGLLVQGNTIERSLSDGLGIFATNAEIIDNSILDCSGPGLFLDRKAGGVVVIGNLLVRNVDGIGMSGLTGATLWFNTIVDSSGTGVLVGAASNLDFRNNIVTGTAFYAVNGNASKFTNFDYNLFFNNGSGDCNGCVLGANVIQADPQYVAPGADDYSLQITSPAVDSGVDLPVDRNGGGADSHDGLEFDRGYYESF